MLKLVVLEDGVEGLDAAYAKAKRLLPVGLSLTAPFAPANEVQPVHFTVSCQCVPLTRFPVVSCWYVAPVYAVGIE